MTNLAYTAKTSHFGPLYLVQFPYNYLDKNESF